MDWGNIRIKVSDQGPCCHWLALSSTDLGPCRLSLYVVRMLTSENGNLHVKCHYYALLTFNCNPSLAHRHLDGLTAEVLKSRCTLVSKSISMPCEDKKRRYPDSHKMAGVMPRKAILRARHSHQLVQYFAYSQHIHTFLAAVPLLSVLAELAEHIAADPIAAACRASASPLMVL